MPDWNLVTRAHVLTAIQECDRVGSRDFLQRYKFGRAGSSSLWHGGQEYDSNAILGVAYLRASGLAPTKDDFSGGKDGAAKVLLDLGFDVVVTEEDPLTAARPATKPVTRTAGKPAAKPAAPRKVAPTRNRRTDPTAAVKLCPSCHMALPATGVCDFCD